MLGYTSQIKEATNLSFIKEKVHIVEKQANWIKVLIADLNLMSRLNFGVEQFEKGNIKVEMTIRKILIDFMNRMDEQKYQFYFEGNEMLHQMSICANHDLFRRMLENLIYNAIRHNSKGCMIKVGCGVEKSHKKSAYIEVIDDGKGVSKEVVSRLNQKKVFEI